MPRGNFLSTNQKHYQDLGSARHQYGISALVTQMSFYEGSSGDLAKRQLFSQAVKKVDAIKRQRPSPCLYLRKEDSNGYLSLNIYYHYLLSISFPFSC